jgi:hypothetical protein
MPVRVYTQGDRIVVHVPYEYPNLGDVLTHKLNARNNYGGNYAISMLGKDGILPLLVEEGAEIEDPEGLLRLPLFQDTTYDLYAHLEALTDFQNARSYLETIHRYDPGLATMKELWKKHKAVMADLGYYWNTQTTYGRDASYVSVRSTQYTWLAELRKEFYKAFKAEMLSDGSLLEYLTGDDFIAFWEEFRVRKFGPPPEREYSRFYPKRSTIPAYFVYLMATLPGPGYGFTGDRMERVYKPWLIRVGEGFARTEVAGANIPLASWCYRTTLDDNLIMHLSVIGEAQQARAVWASLMSGSRDRLMLTRHGQYYHNGTVARRAEGKGKNYTVDWSPEPMAISQLHHMSITHKSNEEPAPGGNGFLHLVGDHISGFPDLDRFFRQIDISLTLPLLPEWAYRLWIEGQNAGLITALDSFNCKGYWVTTNEKKWTNIVQALTLGLTLEEFKSRSDLPEVEVIGEKAKTKNEEEIDDLEFSEIEDEDFDEEEE